MKFFLPYWEDKLDPDFNFESDSFSEGHLEQGSSVYDKYIHEISDKAPYNGILLSLGVFLSKLKLEGCTDTQLTVKGFSNLKDYLRLNNTNEKLELLGDCGAFNYVNEPEPPALFSPDRVAKLYDLLGFDYGISVDHLVVKSIKVKDKNGKLVSKNLTKYEMKKRIKISIENAETFLKITKDRRYGFVPIGSAQGYSPETYRDSVAKLVEMGYDYIALGGLVRSTTKEILEILKVVSPVLKGARLHLLGILRPQQLDDFHKFNVYSFDSASYLRKAWLRSGQNYLSPKMDKWYTAIRVPQIDNPRMIKSIEKAGLSLLTVKELERKCLDHLRKYDNGELSAQEVLNTVIKYDSLFEREGNDGTGLEKRYYETLVEMPWKQCNCPLCKQIGIDIVIFRGTNRNKRRGFHNNLVFMDFLNQKNKHFEQIDAKCSI